MQTCKTRRYVDMQKNRVKRLTAKLSLYLVSQSIIDDYVEDGLIVLFIVGATLSFFPSG